MKRKEEVKRQEMEADKTAAKIVKVGDRCEIRVPGQPVRRATVMFVGKMQKGIAFTFSVLNCNTSLRSSQLQQPVFTLTNFPAGTVDFSKGWWIGVRYDEPLGKNDGM